MDVRSFTPSLRITASIASIAILGAGCTGGTDRDASNDQGGTITERPAATPTATDAADVPNAVGRLVVLDSLGRLTTLDPDGSDEIVLDVSVQGQTLVRQPTWSPDGDRLAWVRLSNRDGEVVASLVTADAGGTGLTETPTAVAPFYLSWDPTATRIAYLGSSASADIELGVVDVAAGSATALDAGTPFYLSWDPAGDQLVVHVGTDRLDRLGLDGTLTTVADRPGVFTAPVWTSDGRTLVYAASSRDGQRLVAEDIEAERAEKLIRFEGGITFVVDRAGSRIAFQLVGGEGEGAPLSVLDRRTGAIDDVVDATVAAFFWSPDGTKLLYLLPEEVQGGVWFRWGVWDGESSFTGPRFLPTQEFGRDYLQFFEQYAQSMSLWAPDGTAFTYAGSSESGETGVWIQPAAEGAEPILVTPGVFAAWSPD